MRSIIRWSGLEDGAFERELRVKLLEEGPRGGAGLIKEELCGRAADLLEVIECICQVNGLSLEDVQAVSKEAGRAGAGLISASM